MNKRFYMKSQFISELLQGIVMRWYWFTAPVIIGVVYTQMLFSRIYVSNGQPKLLLSIGDCIIYMFKGIEEYVPTSAIPFQVPVQFLIINIILAIFIGNYALKDIHGFGKLTLVLSQSKLKWWVSKCIWNICSVITYYFSIFLGIVVACLFNYTYIDNSSAASVLGAHKSIVLRLFACDKPGNLNVGLLLITAIFLPMVTSIALSIMQMALEFLIIPSISYVFLMAVFVFSTFYMKWFMPGNYMMMYRTQFINENGVSLSVSLIVDLIIFIVSFLIGYICIRKYDVLVTEKES